MERLIELVEKEIITLEELQEVEEMENITVEDNGMSGRNIGCHWYTAITEDKEEFDLYVK